MAAIVPSRNNPILAELYGFPPSRPHRFGQSYPARVQEVLPAQLKKWNPRVGSAGEWITGSKPGPFGLSSMGGKYNLP